MIPSIPAEDLSKNPDFARLYTRLLSDLLDDDCSTRAAAQERNSALYQLCQRNILEAKDSILASSLQNLTAGPTASHFSNELRELTYTISVYVSEGQTNSIPEGVHDLMNEDVEAFLSNLPEISAPLSSHIIGQSDELLRQAQKAQEQEEGHDSSQMLSIINALTSPAPTQASNTASLNALQATLVQLSTLTTLLDTTITRLERHTHGTVSRYWRGQAEHLSAVANALALKMQILDIQQQKATYTTEFREALRNYAQHLDDEQHRALDRVNMLTNILTEYEGQYLSNEPDNETEEAARNPGRNSGAAVLEELGKRYGELCREIENVKTDLCKLDPDWRWHRDNT